MPIYYIKRRAICDHYMVITADAHHDARTIAEDIPDDDPRWVLDRSFGEELGVFRARRDDLDHYLQTQTQDED